ncbi:MAG TPA: ABC transporter permease subunit [Gemmataceae bacterium]|nr:ABC transporter permease subunit [Gemmataceae bacterium]
MTFPSALFVIRWLVRDTFRQALANGIFWLMLGVSLICIAVCLTIGTVDVPPRPSWDTPERIPAEEAKKLPPEKLKDQGVDIIEGQVTLGFGAVRIPWVKYREDAVRYVQMLLLGLIADTGGVLLALVWTAGFLPTFLEPGSASVLLAKPVPRWSLLAGKYLGVLVFVAFQALVFVAGVWLALALRTGVWDMTAFLAVPVLLLHFAVFFSFSVLLAVTTRSTVACVFGSLVFWLVCLGMNLGRHAALLQPELQNVSPAFSFLVDAGYWVLPKPADLGTLLVDALQAQGEVVRAINVEGLERKGAWHPELSVLASVGFAIILLAIAAREFVTTDY